jgi:Xaa-Pro aminopeptidase
MILKEAFAARRAGVHERMARLDPAPDALLVTGPENRRYLTGFTGSAGMVLLVGGDALLVTDGRYVEQATEEAPGCRVVRHAPEPFDTLRELVQAAGLRTLGFEKEHVTFAFHEKLAAALTEVMLVPTAGVVESGRAVKEEGELEHIRHAARLVDEVLGEVVRMVRPGISERDIALEIEFRLKRRGAGLAFEPIVASGPRSALPHGRASDRVIETGDFVTIDMGALWHGYASDLTRTFVIGRVDARQEEVYHVVLEAQSRAMEGLRPAMTGREVDALAREVITARGYGDEFGHGLGHGVGLAVHEGPRLSPTGEARLEEGNVVTVEPGVYVPGWGGVRIEALVVVRAHGAERLSGFPRELTVL